MILPLWFVFGLVTAVMSAGMMLSQEKFRISGYAAAFWGKAACAVLMIPFVFSQGFPSDPMFYVYIAGTAVLFAISDVIFFEGITKTNAGAVSRILPSSVILSFLLWFVVNPALLDKYLQTPVISAAIFTVLCLSAFFATRLKKCQFSMSALKAIWFVLVAATIGPLLAKGVTLHADPSQGPYAYVFCQAVMMMSLWVIYIAIRRPAGAKAIFQRASWKGGLAVGLCNVGATLITILAYYHVDNPAYITAVKFTDAAIILLVYKLWKRKTEGDILSGLGVVACAAALVLLKSQVK